MKISGHKPRRFSLFEACGWPESFPRGAHSDWQVICLFVLIYLSSPKRVFWQTKLTNCTWSKRLRCSCILLFTRFFFSIYDEEVSSWRCERWTQACWHDLLSGITRGLTLEAAGGCSGERISGHCTESEPGVVTLPIDSVSLISTACWGLFFQPAGVH